jgi:hypothetical protein
MCWCSQVQALGWRRHRVRPSTSATLNGISFRGNVIADASVTVGSGSNVTGRALAGTGPTGAVTMAGAGGNTIGGCASPASVIAVPALGLGGLATLIALLAGAALLVLGRLSRP